MPITEYPEIQSIRKELNLLQKLYGLYNDVNLKVDGYFDIPWMEVNIEKINLELQEFQNRYKRKCSRCELFYLLLTDFWPMFPFYTPLKTPENLWFSGVFRWYKMGTLARNGLISKL